MTVPVIDSDTSGHEIAALMAFPTDERARKAYVLHLDLTEKAQRGEAVALGPEVLMLMADPNLTYAALMDRAATAMSRGKAAAWELTRQWLSKTEHPPSLARLRAEYDSPSPGSAPRRTARPSRIIVRLWSHLSIFGWRGIAWPTPKGLPKSASVACCARTMSVDCSSSRRHEQHNG